MGGLDACRAGHANEHAKGGNFGEHLRSVHRCTSLASCWRMVCVFTCSYLKYSLGSRNADVSGRLPGLTPCRPRLHGAGRHSSLDGDPDFPNTSQLPVRGWLRRIFAGSVSHATLRSPPTGRSSSRSLGWWRLWSLVAEPHTRVGSARRPPRCDSATARSALADQIPAAE